MALGRFRRLKWAGREALGLRGPLPRKDSARPLLLSDNGLEKPVSVTAALGGRAGDAGIPEGGGS